MANPKTTDLSAETARLQAVLDALKAKKAGPVKAGCEEECACAQHCLCCALDIAEHQLARLQACQVY